MGDFSITAIKEAYGSILKYLFRPIIKIKKTTVYL